VARDPGLEKDKELSNGPKVGAPQTNTVKVEEEARIRSLARATSLHFLDLVAIRGNKVME
jgi:hypothetical protein